MEPARRLPRAALCAASRTTERGREIALRRALGAGKAAIVRQLFTPALNDDPDVSLFTARWNDEPVGGAMSLRVDDTVGVYAVGTLKRARRRGVATAATWAAIDSWRRRGCTVAVLQASEMGLPLRSRQRRGQGVGDEEEKDRAAAAAGGRAG